MDYSSPLEVDHFKKAAIPLIVVLGLGIGLFAQSMFDQPGADETNQLDYTTVSDDPRFESVEPFSASEKLDDKRSYNWSYGSTDLGTWQLEGYGGRAPEEILYGVEEPKMILHPWPQDLDRLEVWNISNISQTVSVPENADRAKVVLRGENAADTLYTGDNLPSYNEGECADSVMVLEIFNQDEESVFAEFEVLSDEDQITANVTDFRGQELDIYGIADHGGECGTNFEWLQINYLGLQAANISS